MILEPAEKTRFSLWLELQISNKMLVEQYKKLECTRDLPDGLLTKKFKLEIVACTVVHKMINDGEVQTITGAGDAEPT